MRLATTLTAIAITTVSGCSFGNARYKETRTINRTSYDAMPLHVRSKNGGIEVERSRDEGVVIVAHIRARTQERLDEVEIVADDLGDGVFEVYAIWPDNRRKSSEGVSYEITYPYTEDVTLATSNGSLRIGEFGGDADLRTSNGRITVNGHDGDVYADSSNGSINLYEITGEVEADTSNGRIHVELTPDNPGPVSLDTSNGAISLEVGEAFEGELEADTSNGRVRVEGTVQGRIHSIRKSYVRLALGDAPHRSVLDTSNGSVTIRIRD
ncbi:MAG: DUF4097 domain-containing protein [Phycisphaerales bacterium JB043]